MKHALIITAIMANLLITCGHAMANEPATIYYTTSGSDPVTSTEDPSASNPPCPESLRVYGDFSRIDINAPCGVPQRRERIWICNDGTGNQGIDVEFQKINCNK